MTKCTRLAFLDLDLVSEKARRTILSSGEPLLYRVASAASLKSAGKARVTAPVCPAFVVSRLHSRSEFKWPRKPESLHFVVFSSQIFACAAKSSVDRPAGYLESLFECRSCLRGLPTCPTEGSRWQYFRSGLPFSKTQPRRSSTSPVVSSLLLKWIPNQIAN